MKTFTLQSASLVYAPSLVQWAINGAAFKDDQNRLINIIAKTWSIPLYAASKLILKQVPYTVSPEGNVVFTLKNGI